MKSKLFKRIAASLLAAALTAAPLVTLAETAASAIDRAFAAATRTAEQPAKNIKVPAGYNEHDYLKLREFLEIEDETGEKNGKKLSYSNYNPDDPETWWSLSWTDTDSGKRIEIVNIDSVGTDYLFYGKLDLSGCTALTELWCTNNQLTELDVSGCTSLNEVWCDVNQLISLNASGCTALETLWCCYNQLTELDASNNTALETLNCSGNQLTELDVSDCTSLEKLYCENNQLAKLDASGCNALYHLDCSDNRFTKLDVSGCTALEDLICFRNQLTKLDLSKNTTLGGLDCSDNRLSELDVSKNAALEILDCSYNQLSKLDLSNNSELTRLNCYDNKLTELDVKNCEIPHLTSLSSEGNGWIGCVCESREGHDANFQYYINLFYSLLVEPMPGCTFEGWYTPDGKLISTDHTLLYYKYEYDETSGAYIPTSLFDTTDFVAKFSGEPNVPGDVDGDGETTVKDALAALRNAMGLLNISDDQSVIADMDGNGRVTVSDALAILRTAMGLN